MASSIIIRRTLAGANNTPARAYSVHLLPGSVAPAPGTFGPGVSWLTLITFVRSFREVEAVSINPALVGRE